MPKFLNNMFFLSEKSRFFCQRTLFVLTVILLLQIILEIFFFPFLNIQFIEINGLTRISKPDLLKVAGITGKEYYFTLNAEFIRKSIKKIPWVKEASVVKKFPDKLKIEIQEREPVLFYFWTDPSYKGTVPVLLDDEGVIFEKGGNTLQYSAPFLSGVQLKDVGLRRQFPSFLRGIFKDLAYLRDSYRSLYNLISEVCIKSKWNNQDYELSLYLINTPILFKISSRLNYNKMIEILLSLDLLSRDKDFNQIDEVDLRTKEAVYHYKKKV